MKQEKMTKFIKSGDVVKKWYVVDANQQVLGRLASKIAFILMGKHKPVFTPNMDNGDYVIVINADKIRLTGKREELKTYVRYSGYPGGQKITSFKEMLAKKPEFVIYHAVKGMLPKNKLGRKIIKNLKIYAGDTHPHAAQKPEPLSL